MPKSVYNNVVGQRLLDDDLVCEDVTKVSLPTLEHPTTEFKSSGLAVDVEFPDTTHLKAMDYSIAHNNGVNCRELARPGKHVQEFRTVRQRYNVQTSEVEHEPVKYRVVGMHVSTDKGDIETGNPYGSTEKYSCLRYEEEIDGEIVTCVDATAGILIWNGIDYADDVNALLD